MIGCGASVVPAGVVALPDGGLVPGARDVAHDDRRIARAEVAAQATYGLGVGIDATRCISSLPADHRRSVAHAATTRVANGAVLARSGVVDSNHPVISLRVCVAIVHEIEGRRKPWGDAERRGVS